MSKEIRERLAYGIVQRLHNAGFEAFYVGGCVRDMLLGVQPEDYDIATNARPDTVKNLFRRTLAVGAQFGVMIVLEEGLQFQVATFRSDSDYADGRHPDSVTFGTAQADALRRDFTINGMMYDPMKKELLDFVGGQSDLHSKVVRCIGAPLERFEEDRLRLLRAVRFAAKLEFEIEQETAAAITALAPKVSSVSEERIREEIFLIITGNGRGRGLQFLFQFGLIEPLLPECARLSPEQVRHTALLLDSIGSPSNVLAFAALFHSLDNAPGRARAAAIRLKFANTQKRALNYLLTNQDRIEEAINGPPHLIKELIAGGGFAELLRLLGGRVRVGCLAEAMFEQLEDMAGSIPQSEIAPPHLLTGDDLINMGYEPSKQFSVVLRSLYRSQLDGKITTKEAAKKSAQHLLKNGERE